MTEKEYSQFARTLSNQGQTIKDEIDIVGNKDAQSF